MSNKTGKTFRIKNTFFKIPLYKVNECFNIPKSMIGKSAQEKDSVFLCRHQHINISVIIKI